MKENENVNKKTMRKKGQKRAKEGERENTDRRRLESKQKSRRRKVYRTINGKRNEVS
jgi:hypothetical protein